MRERRRCTQSNSRDYLVVGFRRNILIYLADHTRALLALLILLWSTLLWPLRSRDHSHFSFWRLTQYFSSQPRNLDECEKRILMKKKNKKKTVWHVCRLLWENARCWLNYYLSPIYCGHFGRFYELLKHTDLSVAVTIGNCFVLITECSLRLDDNAEDSNDKDLDKNITKY